MVYPLEIVACMIHRHSKITAPRLQLLCYSKLLKYNSGSEVSAGVDSHLNMTQSLCVTAQRKCFGRRTVVRLIHKNASDGHHVLVVVVVVIAVLPPFICLERRTEKRPTALRFLRRWGPRLTREDGEQSLPVDSSKYDACARRREGLKEALCLRPW